MTLATLCKGKRLQSSLSFFLSLSLSSLSPFKPIEFQVVRFSTRFIALPDVLLCSLSPLCVRSVTLVVHLHCHFSRYTVVAEYSIPERKREREREKEREREREKEYILGIP